MGGEETKIVLGTPSIDGFFATVGPGNAFVKTLWILA